MFTLRILASPRRRFFSDLHPFYKWKRNLLDAGINLHVHYDHKKIPNSDIDCLIVNHMYFHDMWNDLLIDAKTNEDEWIEYLIEIKKKVRKLIWWDAQDTSCSTGFRVIPYVDVFLKNQVLKDKDYYSGEQYQEKNLRIWLDPKIEQTKFIPCPKNQIDKIQVGWNLGFNDYRYFPFKLHYLLSNCTSYLMHPLIFTNVNSTRDLDLTFRGQVNYDSQFPQHNAISFQRNRIVDLLKKLPLKSAHGLIVEKKHYWKELRSSKISLSPFGYGEVCYRDFESFIAGALMLKPCMNHLVTFPNLFVPYETYIPLSWNLEDLEDKLEDVIINYKNYKHIAENGQELYNKSIQDPFAFIDALKGIIK